LLRLDCPDTSQTVRIHRPEGCQMTVRGPNGRSLDRKIPKSRFPAMLTDRNCVSA
jgi:hypothetical protein